MIVKIQKPIMPPDGAVLIYDQRRRHMESLPMNAKLAKLLGDRLKVYAEAEYRGGTWIVGQRVPDQTW